MDKEFVPYEEALALKELGFDEECIGYFQNDTDRVIFYGGTRTNTNFTKIFKAANRFRLVTPFYQQAFRWFRETHGLNHIIQENNIGWMWTIRKGYVREAFDFRLCHSYEEGELECLKKLIEIVQKSNDTPREN